MFTDTLSKKQTELINEFRLHLIKNEFAKDIYYARVLAETIFEVDPSNTRDYHRSCKFETYMLGWSIVINSKQSLFMLFSAKISSVVSIELTKSMTYHDFELNARKVWFNLE